MPSRSKMTRNMSIVPSQVESRLATPHQYQPNQVKGVKKARAGPQQQQKIPTVNANFFIEVLKYVQHSQ